MKQIFKLSILLLSLTCCVSSIDANAKTKRKAKSAATTSKWIEVARSDETGLISYAQIPVTYDEDGYCYITIKDAPMKNRLASVRRRFVEHFNTNRFNKFTHSITKWKVDIFNNRLMLLATVDYAGDDVLTMDGDENQEWMSPRIGSVGYEVIKAARLAVRGY